MKQNKWWHNNEQGTTNRWLYSEMIGAELPFVNWLKTDGFVRFGQIWWDLTIERRDCGLICLVQNENKECGMRIE